MKEKQIYQFVKLLPNGKPDYLKEISKQGAIPVYDFEDSYFIPFDKRRSDGLKSSARKILKYKIEKGFCSPGITGIRVNGITDINFFEDIKFLSDSEPFNTIFLPKIEDETQIVKFHLVFSENGIGYENLIPVIESKEGIKNIDSILRKCKDNGIDKVAFGHCDYNLDLKRFPFIHQDCPEYWKEITPLIKRITGRGFDFVHSPFLMLDDDNLLREILIRINDISNGAFSQITLSMRQTCVCSEFLQNPVADINIIHNEPEEHLRKQTEDDKIIIAEKLIRDYISFNSGDKGFSVCSYLLISPHEFISAKNFLKSKDIIYIAGH